MNDQVSSYTKEELEKQKLMAEIANLNKSWIRNPASWISILTIVLASFGLAFQYRNHQVEAQEAQMKLDKVKGDLTVVQNELNQKEPRLKQVDEEIDKAANDLKELTSEREEVQTQLAALNAQLKDLEAKASSLPSTPDNQQIQSSLKSASVAIANLQKKNLTIVDKSKSVTESLGRARARALVPQK